MEDLIKKLPPKDKNKVLYCKKELNYLTNSYDKNLKTKVLDEKKTDIFYNEIIAGIDGKYRYFKLIRINIYKYIIKLYIL